LPALPRTGEPAVDLVLRLVAFALTVRFAMVLPLSKTDG
jgi:hypothetical protein